MSRLFFTLPVAVGLFAVSGCVTGVDTPPVGDPDDNVPDPVQPPPPDEPVPPAPAVYKRGSLQPLYQLTPRAEYGRLKDSQNIVMNDNDFISNAGNFVTAAQKMDEIGAQIARERGLAALNLIPRAEDRQRAQLIPFRGNPSDVDVIRINGRRKAYVPLGGDDMTVGNEVASVDLDSGAVTRIKVGVHPQRTAVHPSGLIFVCNQYSNYITIIDPRTDQLLRNAQGPVEIKTEFYCGDLAFVPRNPVAPDPDEFNLYVANRWRASVLKYEITVQRDALSDQPTTVKVTNPATPNPPNQPTAEIAGVGANPYRLTVSQDLRALFVANYAGGEIAKIDLASNAVKRIAVNGPVPEVVQANDVILALTDTIDRGLLAVNDAVPRQVNAAPARVTGLDGNQHIAHPGALLDNTKAYNFEDLRNGLLTIDAQLNTGIAPTYFTDNISPEVNFQAAQKVLQGAFPEAVILTANRTSAFIAFAGSDVVQEVSVRAGAFRISDAPTPLFRTEERPFALALDEQANELIVANWGGETIEVFDRTSANRKRRIDLGYGTLNYPGTNMERGEYFFYNADWSNDGRKSCAQCHADRLSHDGVGFANGATGPTAYHKVPANFNQLTTDSYFWNGSFASGNYASLAADAQTRTNCELILFGLVEGPASAPNARVGSPANRVTNANDAQCRPDTSNAGVLPRNFDQIAQVINQQKIIKDQLVRAETGFAFLDVSRFADFYTMSELRLPPNPLAYLDAKGELDSATSGKIARGKQLFTNSGCANCHNPGNAAAPFTDGLEHGAGVEWRTDFVDTYFNDARIVNAIGAIPQAMVEAISNSVADREINIHLDPIDYFEPFCFDINKCLVFEDPLQVRGNAAAETERIDLIVKINLANAERAFVPGNVRGQPSVNTPSLRGLWTQNNFLRHGHAKTLNETILAPGHKALRTGERGYAIDRFGNKDVHGATTNMSAEDVDALYLYLTSIE